MSSENVNRTVKRMNFGKKGMELSTNESYNRQKKYVTWGKNDDLPQNLNELFYTSPLHQGIVNGKVDKIAGKGFEILEGDPIKIKNFLKNGENDFDLSEIAEKLCLDMELYGGFVMKVVLTTDRSTVSFVDAIETDQSRLSDDEKFLTVSKDLFDRKEPQIIYDVFNTNLETGVYFLYFKLPSKKLKGEKGIYPKPPYMAALKDIETDKDISKFNNSEIRNFFSAGTIINVPTGVPVTDDEKKNAKEYVEKFQDPDDSGGVIVNFSDGVDQAITVVHLTQNDINKRYLQTQTAVQDKIVTGHSLTSPLIVGVKTPGQLGGGEEIAESLKSFVDTYVLKRQRVLNLAFNYVMNNIAKIPGKIGLIVPEVAEPQPQGQFSDQSKKKVDEVISEFSNCGIVPTDRYFSFDIPAGSTPDQASEIATNQSKLFFDEIGSITNPLGKLLTVYDLIKKGTSIPDISDLINETVEQTNKIIQRLKESGMISENMKPTTKGENIAKASEIPTESFEVRYEYVKRDGISGDTIIPTSRDFCRELVSLGRAFTKEEIDMVSSRIGYDVFTLRGGYYHNPQTDQTTPFCRHVWRFILTKKS